MQKHVTNDYKYSNSILWNLRSVYAKVRLIPVLASQIVERWMHPCTVKCMHWEQNARRPTSNWKQYINL